MDCLNNNFNNIVPYAGRWQSPDMAVHEEDTFLWPSSDLILEMDSFLLAETVRSDIHPHPATSKKLDLFLLMDACRRDGFPLHPRPALGKDPSTT